MSERSRQWRIEKFHAESAAFEEGGSRRPPRLDWWKLGWRKPPLAVLDYFGRWKTFFDAMRCYRVDKSQVSSVRDEKLRAAEELLVLRVSDRFGLAISRGDQRAIARFECLLAGLRREAEKLPGVPRELYGQRQSFVDDLFTKVEGLEGWEKEIEAERLLRSEIETLPKDDPFRRDLEEFVWPLLRAYFDTGNFFGRGDHAEVCKFDREGFRREALAPLPDGSPSPILVRTLVTCARDRNVEPFALLNPAVLGAFEALTPDRQAELLRRIPIRRSWREGRGKEDHGTRRALYKALAGWLCEYGMPTDEQLEMIRGADLCATHLSYLRDNKGSLNGRNATKEARRITAEHYRTTADGIRRSVTIANREDRPVQSL